MRRRTPVLLTAVVFAWVVLTMLAVLLVASAALGMYEALLVADLVALAVLAATFVAVRRRRAPTRHDRFAARRARERRGF